ncbi:hypothetical protein HQ32_01782 [Prauserella sp. Am3]|nr:hypothetical protein HQ32_01782 [Prauserella sp. Am3]
MAATLPVPIEFSLPDGWTSADPDEVNAGEVAFIAFSRAAAGDRFAANITINSEVCTEFDGLVSVADGLVEKLGAAAGEIKRGKRDESTTSNGPVLAQVVRFPLSLPSGERVSVVQYQVLMALQSSNSDRSSVVLHFTLSALPDRFVQLLPDFRAFIETVRFETGR